jgi:HAE1 family hydrophobic/amphiphilic exporter-1
MQLIESFVENPVKVSVAVILLCLFGVIALARMPMQLVPEVQIPTLSVETRWPGASPQEVEREIIQEQEEQLQSVEGVSKMTSQSMDSFGQITMEFEIGTDMREALLLVNTRLNQVEEYPENADRAVISTSDSSDRPIAWFVLSTRPPERETLDRFMAAHPNLAAEVKRIRDTDNPGKAMFRLKRLIKQHPEAKELLPVLVDVTKERRFAKDFIEARLERVGGVSNAEVMAGREEELQVVVDPERLAARQLTIMDVRLALRGQNKDTSGGDFWEGKRRYVVRTLGQFRAPEQVANVIIARRDGAPVYVRDVAEIRLGHKKPDGMSRRFGDSVINLNARRRNNANVLDVMAGIREATAELNDGILKQRGMQLTQVYDETEYIYSSMDMVKENIVEGSVLTLIVLLLFLRSFRSALVIFLAIGVSTIGMFLALSLMGRSLNVLSMAGIAFAVGMLVDNFIVVLENVYRHYQQGDTAAAATVRGTKEVWGAVVASSLANLAVFLPVLFVRDEAGQLFRDIALAVSAALCFSLLVALVMVPTAAAIILRHSHAPEEAPLRSTGRRSFWRRRQDELAGLGHLITRPLDRFGVWFVNTVVGANVWLQRSTLRQLVVAGGMVGVSVFLSWLLMPKIDYLPSGNRNLVIAIILPPPGYNLDQLARIGEIVENRLQPYWDVDPGTPEAAKLKYPVISDMFYVARGRSLFMGVRSDDALRAGELVNLLKEMGRDIPGTILIAKQTSLFERGLSGGRTVDVEITGPEIEKLVGLGGRVMRDVMQLIPEAQALPEPSLDLSSPEMHITPKWQQAADMGVNATDLGYTVDALVDGAYASDYFVGGDKIDLSIIGQEEFVTRTQDLWGLSIATPNGELVPLAAVADVELSSGPEQINHRERMRAITIQVSPPASMPLEEAMNVISTKIVDPIVRSGELGGAYQINFSGTADKLNTTWQSMRWNLLLAFIITYLVMSALFESWLYPFIIILSVPLGAVGGFFGLWLLNQSVLQPLDVLTMLGFIILIGTVVNNPILIVEQALNHMRDDGMDPHSAVIESVRTRIRPIFMTASIGLFGLLPLCGFDPFGLITHGTMFVFGAGSELYRGLGAVLLGGLVFSTVFTLIFVPTIFSLVFSIRDWFAGGRRRPAEAPRVTVVPEPHRVGALAEVH